MTFTAFYNVLQAVLKALCGNNQDSMFSIFVPVVAHFCTDMSVKCCEYLPYGFMFKKCATFNNF